MPLSSINLISEFKPELNPDEKRVRVVMHPEAKFVAVVPGGKPPQVRKFGCKPLLNLDLVQPASAVDFRPLPFEYRRINGNPELAVAFGPGSSQIGRYDLALESSCGALDFENATSVAYSHDGNCIAAGSSDGWVKVWRLHNRGCSEFLCQQVSRRGINNVALSANKDVLFFTTLQGDFMRMTVQEGSMPGPCMNDTYLDGSPLNFNCYTVACHPWNNAWAAFGGDSNVVHIVDYGAGKVHSISSNVGAYVREVRFLPNEKEISIVGELGAEVYELSSLKSTRFRAVANGAALTARQYGAMLFVARR